MSLTNSPRNPEGRGLGSYTAKPSYHDSAVPSFKLSNVISFHVKSSADVMDES